MKDALLSLALAVPLLAMPAFAETGEADAIDSTRSTLAKYVETKQIISKEKQDWQLGKEVLEQRIALLEGEIASLRDKIAEARSGINEAASKQRELVNDNEEYRAAAVALVETIGGLEATTRRLLVAVPEPLATRVEPLSRKLPKEAGETTLSLSQRFQNVLGILNEVNKFNGEITVVRELRDLPDGTQSEVETLYMGLAQAYYVAPDGATAGTGVPGPEGWSWKAANELAGEIARTIAILQNEDVPAYVSLPVEVQ